MARTGLALASGLRIDSMSSQPRKVMAYSGWSDMSFYTVVFESGFGVECTECLPGHCRHR